MLSYSTANYLGRVYSERVNRNGELVRSLAWKFGTNDQKGNFTETQFTAQKDDNGDPVDIIPSGLAQFDPCKLTFDVEQKQRSAKREYEGNSFNTVENYIAATLVSVEVL